MAELRSKKSEGGYIRIKLALENKAKGFYLLMVNGNTYSDKEDEFVIERKFITILNKEGINYKII